jgi:hypothetical protein
MPLRSYIISELQRPPAPPVPFEELYDSYLKWAQQDGKQKDPERYCNC